MDFSPVVPIQMCAHVCGSTAILKSLLTQSTANLSMVHNTIFLDKPEILPNSAAFLVFFPFKIYKLNDALLFHGGHFDALLGKLFTAHARSRVARLPSEKRSVMATKTTHGWAWSESFFKIKMSR